ncbi:type VI secretion system ATPase TssH [Reinekea marinisedimentorum]|uniref:Type VI secretion system protein VasG n=1 Tax=Reinekea marinisedimentorum TaxID=230495 RepID=A0A4R3IAB6_9GAMM|nr:type VI secretion system ATPase TssH [Reinekea marinisedimentorum]TCS41300.1 type VI secretion system protein VasG [Reinekea marinisedimentorum]
MDGKTLRALLDKLNGQCGQMMEAAAGFTISRGHYQITIEHLLIKLLEDDHRYGIDAVLEYFQVNIDELWQGLIDSINSLRSGHQGKPGMSENLFQVLEKACVINSVHYRREDIDSVSILEAVIELSPSFPGFSAYRALDRVSLDELRAHRFEITKNCSEGAVRDVPAGGQSSVRPQAQQGESALDQFTTDLTAKAKNEDMDPITGRNEEIRMAIDILCRRRKNNPILVGEPGVGKTAVVEGLAQKVARGEVPDLLKNIRICVLDMGLLQAGAGVKGEFERRLKQVIDEVKESATPVMLFIDEAHTLIGAGGEAGLSDAANLLKPALARGELRTIAATTFSEYKQYFEKDPALARRFQLVKVEEPTIEAAILMLNGLKGRYQQHHEVRITDAAVEAAVTLSDRYITGRYLPDKAIDLLDTAAARVRMGQSVIPSKLESLAERQNYLETRLQQIADEQEAGMLVNDSLQETLQKELQECLNEAESYHAQWQQESALVGEIHQHVKNLTSQDETADLAAVLAHSQSLRSELTQLQAERPLVQPEVNELAIADVVADWTGVPVGSMSKSDLQSVLTFEEAISDVVIGQDLALQAMGKALRSAKAGLRTSEGPVGVFLLTGPSGVGKTETARAIAEHMFGSSRALITINMSEYQEAHTVSQLKGSPPGYVGYGQGGILTEAVRQRPYSVVLLDEVEKAHPDVMNLFYQVFDRGFMRDGEGREIDFKNTLILMTSNVGSAQIQERCTPKSADEKIADIMSAGEEDALEKLAELSHQSEEEQEWQEPGLSELQTLVKPELLGCFAPALLARMQVVPFVSLSGEVLAQIVSLKLEAIARRLMDLYQIEFRCDQTVLSHLAGQCELNDSGARFVNSMVDQQLMPGIAQSLLHFISEDDVPDILTLVLNEEQQLECVFADKPAVAEAVVLENS